MTTLAVVVAAIVGVAFGAFAVRSLFRNANVPPPW